MNPQRVLTRASRPYLSLSPESRNLAEAGYEEMVSCFLVTLGSWVACCGGRVVPVG